MTELKITSRAHLKEVLTRNGFYLPKSDCFCTLEYLAAVSQAQVFTLNYEEIKRRPCPRPPTRAILMTEIERVLAPMDQQLSLDNSKCMPEKEYLLTVLATIYPDHEIFERDYLPPPLNRPTRKLKPLFN